MKNVFKTIAVLAASLLAFGACQGELEQPEQIEKSEATHSVTFVAGAPETKTAANVDVENGIVNYNWTEYDVNHSKFQVFEDGKAAESITLSLIGGVMNISAEFEGTERPAAAKYTGYFNYGVQPIQAAVGENYDQDSDVLVAKETSTYENGAIPFQFKRLGAIAEVTLKGLSGAYLYRVTIESTDGTFLAGPFDEEKGELVGESESIMIDCSNIAILNGEATLRFVSLPISGARLRFIVETTDGGETVTHKYVKSFAEGAAIDFTQGNLTGFSVSLGDYEQNELFFYESFNKCDGTGGNDDKWSGSIASSDMKADNEEWNFNNGYAAHKCAKFGTGSKKGSAEIQSIDITTPTAKLMFKAAAWDGSSEGTTLNLSATGATLSNSSVTLKKGQWSTYVVDITKISESVNITIEANNASDNRFFLDEVYVYFGTPKPNPTIETTNKEITLSGDPASASQSLTDMFSSNSNGIITYSLKEASTTASISGSTFTATAAGTYTIVASQAATDTYNAGSAEATITVNEEGAGPKSYTITFRVDSGDGSKASTSTLCSSVVSDGFDYLSGNLDIATNVYYKGGSGLKLGTSSGNGSIKMNLSSKGQVNCKSIVVRAKLYNSSKAATLKVNGSATQNLASDFADYTYNITGNLSYLELVSSKYCWVESITVNY